MEVEKDMLMQDIDYIKKWDIIENIVTIIKNKFEENMENMTYYEDSVIKTIEYKSNTFEVECVFEKRDMKFWFIETLKINWEYLIDVDIKFNQDLLRYVKEFWNKVKEIQYSQQRIQNSISEKARLKELEKLYEKIK